MTRAKNLYEKTGYLNHFPTIDAPTTRLHTFTLNYVNFSTRWKILYISHLIWHDIVRCSWRCFASQVPHILCFPAIHTQQAFYFSKSILNYICSITAFFVSRVEFRQTPLANMFWVLSGARQASGAQCRRPHLRPINPDYIIPLGYLIFGDTAVSSFYTYAPFFKIRNTCDPLLSAQINHQVDKQIRVKFHLLQDYANIC